MALKKRKWFVSTGKERIPDATFPIPDSGMLSSIPIQESSFQSFRPLSGKPSNTPSAAVYMPPIGSGLSSFSSSSQLSEICSIGDDNDIPAAGKHVCSICNRSFNTYQALGGHKAHHNNHHCHQMIPQKKKPSTEHKCTLCNKIFPKGQALGGHKRHCKAQLWKHLLN